MSNSAEIQNLALTLLSGAVFSAIHTSIAILFLVYFEYIYIIGKLQAWPLIIYLTCGVIFNSFFVSKRQNSKSKTKVRTGAVRIRDIFKATGILTISVVVFYAVAVLFGAPFYSAQEETFMFSLLLTILVVLPLILNLGSDVTISILSSANVFEKDAFGTIFSIAIRFVLFGAWLGAVVIPLDWDRPWQEWPIPCSSGALVGYVISQVFMLILNLPKIAETLNQMLIKRKRKYEL